MIRVVSRKLYSFWRLPQFIKLSLLPVCIMLPVARFAVIMIPFRRISPLLGVSHSTGAFVPLITYPQEKRATEIRAVIRLASKFSPFGGNCFAQAITARVLLRLYRIPHSVFLGLRTSNSEVGGIAAHAWTAAGRVAVTGGYSFDRYTVVGTYAG